LFFFFFQAEDGIRDIGGDWSSDVCSSDLDLLVYGYLKWFRDIKNFSQAEKKSICIFVRYLV